MGNHITYLVEAIEIKGLIDYFIEDRSQSQHKQSHSLKEVFGFKNLD